MSKTAILKVLTDSKHIYPRILVLMLECVQRLSERNIYLFKLFCTLATFDFILMEEMVH